MSFGVQFLLSLFFCALWSPISGYHVLLIGDSVDRFIVHDWCYLDQEKPSMYEEFECPICQVWNSDTMERFWLSFICRKGDNSIANLFLLGSKDGPPYPKNVGRNPLSHTKNLLPKGIDDYFEKNGIPDMIIFNIMFWDIGFLTDYFHALYPQLNAGEFNTMHSAAWNASLEWYEANIKRRILDVEVTVAKNIEKYNVTKPINIGFRSSVYNEHFGSLIHGMNDLLRNLAIEHNYSFYEYDQEVWSVFNYNYDNDAERMLRDGRFGWHPKPIFTALAAEHLLGLKYTRNLIVRGPHTPRYPVCILPTSHHLHASAAATHPYACPASQMLTNINHFSRVRLVALAPAANNSRNPNMNNNNNKYVLPSVRAQDRKLQDESFQHSHQSETMRNISLSQFYFLIYEEAEEHNVSYATRVGPLPGSYLYRWRLSPYDLVFLSANHLEQIPLSKQPLALQHLDQNSVTVFQESKGQEQAYYVFFRDREGIFRRFVCPLDGLVFFNISRDDFIPRISKQLLKEFGYEEKAMLPPVYHEGALLRFQNDKWIHVVLNNSKHSIPSLAVFMKYGSDWSQVVSVSDKEDFDRIPVGTPL